MDDIGKIIIPGITKAEKITSSFYEKPNFSNRVIESINNRKEVHHKSYNLQYTIMLLALRSPWDLDMLISKGSLENLVVEDKNKS